MYLLFQPISVDSAYKPSRRRILAVFEFFVMLNFRKIFIYIATTGRSVKSKGSISSMYHSNRSVIPVLCYSSCLITLLFSWPDVSFYRALMCLSSSILKWLEMPLWRAVSVGIYSVVSDWNQHHSRRISTNHQLQWRKGARNILIKSPQCHVMYLSASRERLYER